MPIQTLLIMLVIVIAAGALTVAAVVGMGAWAVAPVIILVMGLRVWAARRDE